MREDERFPVPTEWVSEEVGMLADSVARWAQQEVMAKRHALREDVERLHGPALRSLMVEVGLQDLLWPEQGDDDGSTAVSCAAVLEQVGRADTGLAVALANTWVVQRLAPPALQLHLGERGSLCSLVLPGFGGQRAGEPADSAGRAGQRSRLEPSDGLHGLRAQVQASRQGEDWQLSGRQVRPLINGADAACFGVVCVVDGAPALFAVPGAAKGIGRGEPLRQTGLNACRNADLALADVTVGAEHLLASGAAGYRDLLAWTYLGCAAAAVGGQLTAWRIIDDWADVRVIKGKGQPFKDNPLVASLLGDIGERVVTSRALVYQLARRLDTAIAGDETTFALATAVTRTALRNTMDCLDHGMELMASAGYATEWNLERYWRDIKTLSTYLMLETAGRIDLARFYFGCSNL